MFEYQPKNRHRHCLLSLKMIPILAGVFIVFSPKNKPDVDRNEDPVDVFNPETNIVLFFIVFPSFLLQVFDANIPGEPRRFIASTFIFLYSLRAWHEWQNPYYY